MCAPVGLVPEALRHAEFSIPRLRLRRQLRSRAGRKPGQITPRLQERTRRKAGEDERFHGSLERKLLARHQWRDGEHLQAHLAPWRQQYNCLRPHEALELEVPASRYQPSLHPYPEQLEPIHYPPGMPVRKVQDKGRVHYQGRLLPVSQAFRGQPVGVRATATDGLVEVLFCHQVVKRLNLAECQKAK